MHTLFHVKTFYIINSLKFITYEKAGKNDLIRHKNFVQALICTKGEEELLLKSILSIRAIHSGGHAELRPATARQQSRKSESAGKISSSYSQIRST